MSDPTIRRLLMRIKEGALLRRAGGAFLISGRRGPKASVALELVEALIAEGLLVETEAGTQLTAEGEKRIASRAALCLEARAMKDEDGRERYVVVNAAEAPLSLLRHRGLVSVTAFEAGEKLRRDYTIGQISPRMGVDYSAPVGSHAFRPDLAETVVAARQRFNHAMRAAGPGLAEVLFDVCCYLMSLEVCEQNHGWPRGSARVVLILALERLAGHYGMAAPKSAHTRSWSKSEES